MLQAIEVPQNHFYEYFNPYINKDWKQEYFAYDHFKIACKTIKNKHQHDDTFHEILEELKQQCHDEIQKVHRFIINIVLTIDLDLQTINEILENEGIRVKKPSKMRSVMTKRASESSLLYSDQRHVARQSSIVMSHQTVTRSISTSKPKSLVAQIIFPCLYLRCSPCLTSSHHKHNSTASHTTSTLGTRDDDEELVDLEEGTNIGENDRTALQTAMTLTSDCSFRDRSIELSLRNVYRRIKQLEQFYHLNFYIIRKISKKIDKLLKVNQEMPHEGIKKHKEDDRTACSCDHRGNQNGNKSHNDSSNSSNTISECMDHRNNMKVFRNLDIEVEVEGISLNQNYSPISYSWKQTKSGQFFYKEFIATKRVIEELKDECVTSYAKKFRKNYTELATYELEYVKEKDRTNSSTKLYVGLKMGLIACMVTWLLVDSYSMENHNDFNFWAQPGLFVYTTIGNLLLYRLCWAFNILIWSKYDINYISVLHLKNIKPNQLVVINETATLLVFYFVTLLIFFRVNVTYISPTMTVAEDYPFLSYGCPLLLLIVSILYLWYEFLYLFGGATSHGIFNLEVIQHCMQVCGVASTFRDIFAADVLTSFTRIIADSLYASCWIISGSFLQLDGTVSDFGSEEMHCTGQNMIYAVSMIQMIPLFIRTLQCFRGVSDDSFHFYPLGYNAIKYILSILVVVLGLTVGNTRNNGGNGMIVYYCFIVLSASYKWWWDVVMDWGLFEVIPTCSSCQSILGKNSHASRKKFPYTFQTSPPHTMLPSVHPDAYSRCATYCPSLFQIFQRILKSKFFLRSSLMFPSIFLYYGGIVLDLILRFLWILSLLPPNTLPKEFAGYQLSFFLGSMEILRRCMWAMLRVEHEHLKMLKKKTPGFLSNRVMRKQEAWFLSSGDEQELGSKPSKQHQDQVQNPSDDEERPDMDGKDNCEPDMDVGIRMRNIRSKLNNTNSQQDEIPVKFQELCEATHSTVERKDDNNEDYQVDLCPLEEMHSGKTLDEDGEINSRRLRLHHQKSIFDLPLELRAMNESDLV